MEIRQAVAVLAALAQHTRLCIYRRLVQAGKRGLPVGEIGAAVRSTGATLTFHLTQLAQAGLIASRQEGRYVFYYADYERMNAVLGFLTDNCCVGDRSGSARGSRHGKTNRNKRAIERPARGDS